MIENIITLSLDVSAYVHTLLDGRYDGWHRWANLAMWVAL